MGIITDSLIAEILWEFKNLIIGVALIALALYSYSLSGEGDASFSVAIGFIGILLVGFDLFTK